MIKVTIEIPKGSPNKYEVNEQGQLELDRVLYSAQFFPFNYGFVGNSLSQDNDPLDIVLLSTYPVVPGCIVSSRVIGVLLMEDEAGIDSKIIAVPEEKIEPRLKQLQDIKDIPEHTKKEIQEFFETYKNLEPDKFVKITGWNNKKKALEIVKQAFKRYESEKK